MKSGKYWAGLLVPAVVLALVALPAAKAANHDEDALKQMDDAKLTLVKAIDAAEAASKGKAIGAHVKLDGKTGEVIVHCVVDGKCMAMPVDIKTAKAGKMTECTAKEEAQGHSGKAKDIVKMLDEDKMSLIKAIELAKGKAVSAKSKLEGGKLEIVVRASADGKWQNVTVDTKTKAVKTDEAKREKKDKEKKEEKAEKKGEKKP